MASSFWSFLAIFVAYFFSSLPFTTCQVLVQHSTIAAAPAFLPEAPLSSTALPPTSSLSPDIEPVFPTTGGASVPSPTESSLPTIPSSPSPPNPDVFDPEAPGPVSGISPSQSLAASSAISLTLCLSLHSLGLLVFFLLQLQHSAL